MLLGELSNLPGVSGNEEAVREYIISRIKDHCDDYKVDKAGNIISVVKSSENEAGNKIPGGAGNSAGSNTGDNAETLKIMLAAHMDEVGFIISGIDRNGNLKFMPVGGIDPKCLPGCRVLVGNNDIKGVIGIKAIHLQSEAEFKKTINIENLRIDIGSDNKKQTEKLVSLGDYAVFDTVFEEFGDELYSGKAFDDRVGCSILIELLRNIKRQPFDLYVCFTVKEEIGSIGAKILANEIKPDIAFIIEGTTCADIPGIENHQASSFLNKGPVLVFMDASSISDEKLNEFIEKTAKENQIPYQYKNTITGGNDAAAIQRGGLGARTASLSVPCRYIHSPVSVISKQDYDNTFYLLLNILENIKGSQYDQYRK